MLAVPWTCLTYDINTLVSWHDAGCADVAHVSLLLFSGIMIPFVLCSALLFKFLVTARSPVRNFQLV